MAQARPPGGDATPGGAATLEPLSKWPGREPGAASAAAERGEAAKRALGGAMLVLLCGAAYALRRLLQLLWPARWLIAAALAAGEVAFFFLWYRRRYSQLNTQPAVHAPAHVDSMRLFKRFVSLVRSLPEGVDIEMYLTAWFRCVDEDDRAQMVAALGCWRRERRGGGASRAHRTDARRGGRRGRDRTSTFLPLLPPPTDQQRPTGAPRSRTSSAATWRSSWRTASGTSRCTRWRPRASATCRGRWSASSRRRLTTRSRCVLGVCVLCVCVCAPQSRAVELAAAAVCVRAA